MTDDDAVRMMTTVCKMYRDQDCLKEEADRFVEKVLRQHGFPKVADYYFQICDATYDWPGVKQR